MPPSVWAKSSNTIAVLPFTINMLKPMDHLVFDLQKMLGARLADKGFKLVDTDAVNSSRLPTINLSEVDTLRMVANEMKINWLIKGSLTQIGEKISLDFAIIPMSDERRPFPVFLAGDRIEQIAQSIERVAVIVENRIRGIIHIDSIRIAGNKRYAHLVG